jgi:hypothetical protein
MNARLVSGELGAATINAWMGCGLKLEPPRAMSCFRQQIITV